MVYSMRFSGTSLLGSWTAVQEILNPRLLSIKSLINRRVAALDWIVKSCTVIFPLQLKMALYNTNCNDLRNMFEVVAVS